MAAFGQLGCAKELKTLCGMELIMQPKDKVGHWGAETLRPRSCLPSDDQSAVAKSLSRAASRLLIRRLKPNI